MAAKKRKTAKGKKQNDQPVIIDRKKVTGDAYMIDDPKTKKLSVVAVIKAKGGGESMALAAQGTTAKQLNRVRAYPNVTAVGKRYPRITPVLRKLK